MAQIYSRSGSPFWWISYTLAGQRVRESTGIRRTTNRSEPARNDPVWDFARTIEDRIARQGKGVALRDAGMTVGAWFTEFAQATATLRAPTRKIYGKVADAFLAWCATAGIVTLRDITRAVACRYRDYLIANFAGTTAKLQYKVLHAAWEEAIGREYVESNPWRLREIKATPAREQRPFTMDELRALLEVRNPWWFCAMNHISAWTGARISSVRALCWEHCVFDGDASFIKFVHSKTNEYIVPMHSELRRFLEQHRQAEGPVLGSEAARSAESLSGSWRGMAERKAGVKGHHHMFRHTVSSLLAQAGVPERIAMEITNHRSPAVHGNYVHVNVVRLAPYLEQMKLDKTAGEEEVSNA